GDVHHHQSRHLRRPLRDADHQPAAGGDPGRRRREEASGRGGDEGRRLHRHPLHVHPLADLRPPPRRRRRGRSVPGQGEGDHRGGTVHGVAFVTFTVFEFVSATTFTLVGKGGRSGPVVTVAAIGVIICVTMAVGGVAKKEKVSGGEVLEG